MYKLLKTLLDPQTELKVLLKNYVRCVCDSNIARQGRSLTRARARAAEQKETLRRVEQISSTLLPTFLFFLRNTVYLLINRTSIPPLLKRLQGKDALAPLAGVVLEFVARHQPGLFKVHGAELSKALAGKEGEERVARIALHAAAKMGKGERGAVVEKWVVESRSWELWPGELTSTSCAHTGRCRIERCTLPRRGRRRRPSTPLPSLRWMKRDRAWRMISWR